MRPGVHIECLACGQLVEWMPRPPGGRRFRGHVYRQPRGSDPPPDFDHPLAGVRFFCPRKGHWYTATRAKKTDGRV